MAEKPTEQPTADPQSEADPEAGPLSQEELDQMIADAKQAATSLEQAADGLADDTAALAAEAGATPGAAEPPAGSAADPEASPAVDTADQAAASTSDRDTASQSDALFSAPDRAGTEDGSQQNSTEARRYPLPSFDDPAASPAFNNDIDLLNDVELDVKIELGRTYMYVDDILRLREGSVVELDKLAGDPVDVLVNDRVVARGEILVLNDNFCVRINEILTNIGEE